MHKLAQIEQGMHSVLANENGCHVIVFKLRFKLVTIRQNIIIKLFSAFTIKTFKIFHKTKLKSLQPKK